MGDFSSEVTDGWKTIMVLKDRAVVRKGGKSPFYSIKRNNNRADYCPFISGVRPQLVDRASVERTLMLFAIVSAFTFFAMGQHEARDGSRSNGVLWAGLSVGVSWLVLSIFHGGMLFEIIGQLGLFVGIAIFRVVRES